MSEQPELNFTAARDPEVHARLPELVELLAANGRMTRRELERHGFTERQLREIVESDMDGQILSFPGSNGYALFDRCEFAEVERAPQALISQGKRMIRRGLVYQRRRHRKFPPRGDAGDEG